MRGRERGRESESERESGREREREREIIAKNKFSSHAHSQKL